MLFDQKSDKLPVTMDPKDEIKEKTDIVALIGEYLELKPAGMHGFRALCPFHGEKSPSFHVSSDRQIYHCFGCGEGGDVFAFVMKMEGMDFYEALTHLGKKAGVEIKRFDTADGNVKQRLLSIHELATSFYKQVLTTATLAEVARDYLSKRGITPELIEKFEIGFAPDDWSKLSDALLKRGFSETELVQAGLSLKKKSGSGLIDRFRNRVMIPLRDQHGNTVGFTGRQLPGGDSAMGKYVNSPETPIYHKGRLVYGLDLAKRAIKEKQCAIIVEGNLDVVASHKAHVENVVASSGTALTLEQLELLKRYTNTVVFCFDRDAAGLNAAKKGVSIARSLDYDVRALILPRDVKDPDDLVQKDSSAWQKISEESVPFLQFIFEQTFANRDITNVDHKRAITQELIPAIAEITDVIEREHWTEKLASLLNVDLKVTREAIANTGKVTDVTKVTKVTEVGKGMKISKKDQIAQLLIGVALNDELNRQIVLDELAKAVFENASLESLYNFVRNAYTSNIETAKNAQPFFARIRSLLEADPTQEHLLSLLDQSSLIAEETFGNVALTAVLPQLNILFETLRASDLHSRRSVIAQKLRQAEDAGDVETVKKLLSEL